MIQCASTFSLRSNPRQNSNGMKNTPVSFLEYLVLMDRASSSSSIVTHKMCASLQRSKILRLRVAFAESSNMKIGVSKYLSSTWAVKAA